MLIHQILNDHKFSTNDMQSLQIILFNIINMNIFYINHKLNVQSVFQIV